MQRKAFLLLGLGPLLAAASTLDLQGDDASIHFGKRTILRASCDAAKPSIRYFHPTSILDWSDGDANLVKVFLNNVSPTCATTFSIAEPCASKGTSHPALFACGYTHNGVTVVDDGDGMGLQAQVKKEQVSDDLVGHRVYLACYVPRTKLIEQFGGITIPELEISVLFRGSPLPFDDGVRGGNMWQPSTTLNIMLDAPPPPPSVPPPASPPVTDERVVYQWEAYGSSDYGFNNAAPNGGVILKLEFSADCSTYQEADSVSLPGSVQAHQHTGLRTLSSSYRAKCWRLRLAEDGTGGDFRLSRLKLYMDDSGVPDDGQGGTATYISGPSCGFGWAEPQGVGSAFSGADNKPQSTSAYCSGSEAEKWFGLRFKLQPLLTTKALTSWEALGSTEYGFNNFANGAVTVYLEQSSDGISWTDVDSVRLAGSRTAQQTTGVRNISPTAATYFKVGIREDGGGDMRISAVKLYSADGLLSRHDGFNFWGSGCNNYSPQFRVVGAFSRVSNVGQDSAAYCSGAQKWIGLALCDANCDGPDLSTSLQG